MDVSSFFAPIVAAAISCLATVAIASGMRREKEARDDAALSTRLDDVARRVAILEASTVSRHEFDTLSTQLMEIRSDLRQIMKSLAETSSRRNAFPLDTNR